MFDMNDFKFVASLIALCAILFAFAVFAAGAEAAEDLGQGACVQTDGQTGLWDGTTADDAGCITPDEYQELFSLPNLVAAGWLSDFEELEDGIAVVTFAYNGDQTVVETDPLDRIVAANPELEPDAPSVRKVFTDVNVVPNWQSLRVE